MPGTTSLCEKIGRPSCQITQVEVVKVLKKMKLGKAAGSSDHFF